MREMLDTNVWTYIGERDAKRIDGGIIELDGLGLHDHRDEHFFRQLVQYGCVWLASERPTPHAA
jgi:hypothetical protein